MVSQMAKYLDTVYVSGWQCSSTASSTNEPSPDLADYPMVSLIFTGMKYSALMKVGYCSKQSSSPFYGPAFP